MNPWTKVKNWWASLGTIGGLPVPDAGRSSVDETLLNRVSAFLAGYDELAPGLNFEVLACLRNLWLFNPDLAQAVSNLCALANTGHKLVIEAQGSRRVQAAVTRLNELAQRIDLDASVRAQMAQLAWSGAISREDVIDLAARRVRQVALVPPDQIRFRAKDGQWQPYQQPRTSLWGAQRSAISEFGLVELHPSTYRYLAWQRVDDSPYAKPPFTAALEPLLRVQADMQANLRKVVQKFGLFGLMSVQVVPPKQKTAQETDQEYLSRVKTYLSAVRESFEKAMNGSTLQNLFVTARDQKVEVTPSVGDARGASDLWNLNEEQVFSGLNTGAWAHGRNYTTTETFADVAFFFLVAQAADVQQITALSLKRTATLELGLAGIEAQGVHYQFNPIRNRSELSQAQAEKARQDIVLSDLEAGFISPDQAAQQRGYEAAFDPERATGSGDVPSEAGLRRADLAEFSYDRPSRRYRFMSSRIEVSSAGLADGNLLDFWTGKKKVRARKRTS